MGQPEVRALTAKRNTPWRISMSAITTEDQLALSGQLCADYRHRWDKCTDHEKLVLFQVAKYNLSGFNPPAVRSLLGHGLLLKDPKLHLVTPSFRRYVLVTYPNEGSRIELPVNHWESFRLPLMGAVVGVAIFLFFTQRETWNLLVTLIPAFLGGLAALFKLWKPPADDKSESAK